MGEKIVLKNGSVVGINRALSDLLFILASGPEVENDFSYSDQLDYYREHIFGDDVDLSDLEEYASKYKKASKIMFPGCPDQIRNRSLLIKTLAEIVLLESIYSAESFDEIENGPLFVKKCQTRVGIPAEDAINYNKEISTLYGWYNDGFSNTDYNLLCDTIYQNIEQFEVVFKLVVDACFGNTKELFIEPFTALCNKLQIDAKKRKAFRLQIDAIAEIASIKNDYADYYDSLKNEWENILPEYPFCHEIKNYVAEKKKPYVIIYGNHLRLLRKDNLLFEMLASVTAKIGLADGARDPHSLDNSIKNQTYSIASNLREYFIDCKKKIISSYHLDEFIDNNFEADLNEFMIPFKKDLMFLKELIMEEINFRNKGNTVSKIEKNILRNSKGISEYELLLSERDAEIHYLKRELSYYEKLDSNNFKSEVSQYDKAMTDLVQKLCDIRYGSVLNELYLISTSKKEATVEEIKANIRNLFFLLNAVGISAYASTKVGNTVHFFDDEVNDLYSIDEKNVKEGKNLGKIIYPGWKYKDSELILPRVELCEEDNNNVKK